MPELPDVEIYRRHLDRHAIGRAVVEVHAPSPEILRHTSPHALGRQLHGQRLEESGRHGKYLFARYAPGHWLVMHFGMTGRLASVQASDELPPHTDLVLALDDGSRLAYVAPRKLGMVDSAEDPRTFAAEQGLGPDALALGRREFEELAAGRRGGVKCWLMNQEIMAGIGNVYSDETLFQARLHPKTAVAALDSAELGNLFSSLSRVLTTAIEAGADPERRPDDFLLPHRRRGATCPRCGTGIERIQACGRGAFYCPGCQDRRPG